MDKTLSEQLEEYRAGWMQRVPAERRAKMERHIAHLVETGFGQRGKQVGDRAPAIVLPDAYGRSFDVASLLKKGPVVVTFYRGGWCPYCNIALRTYQAELVPALVTRGISLIAISPQTADGSLSSKETKELTFTVLSDPGNQLARQLGILTAPSEGVRQAQLQIGLDLTQVNADGTTGLPMPTVIIADAAGTIRWIDVHRDYTTRTEPEQVLRAITQTIS